MSFFAGVAALALAGSCGEALVFDEDQHWPAPADRPMVGSGKILVTNSGDDTVSWIDLDTLTEVYRQPVGFLPPEREGPHHVSASPDGKSYFVGISNYVPGSGSGPHGSHGTGTVPGSLLKYDAATLELVGSARVDRSPGDVRITADGTKVLQTHFDLIRINQVAEAGGPIEDMYAPLAIVDAGTMDVSLVPVCPAPHGVFPSDDGTRAYVACYASDELAVVDLAAKTVERFHVGTAPIEPTQPTYQPYALAVHPEDGTVWVSHLGSADVRIWDPATKTFADTPIPVGGPAMFGQFSTDGAHYYLPVQTANALVVIDVAQRKVLTTLPLQLDVCRAPHAVLLLPGEQRLVTVCEGDHVGPGSLLVVNIGNPATPAVEKKIDVGVFPDDANLLRSAP